MKKYDVIVVGCGLSGAVVARKMAEKDKKVLVIERRNHICGNLYDYEEEGIHVHKYGPHTFHTNNKQLVDFIMKYEQWDSYKLKCGAIIDGKYTPTPFNFSTIDIFFSVDKAEEIKRRFAEKYPTENKVYVIDLLKSEDDLLREYASFLFEKDYKPYTSKQWGISTEEIDSSILKRVPIKLNYEEGYFDDEYQLVPHTSYNMFFSNLISHDNIEIRRNTCSSDLVKIQNNIVCYNGIKYDGILVYTGMLDELFDYKFGHLPYRSLIFEWKKEQKKDFQKDAVVAYPQNKNYTRITEYTKLPYQNVGDRTCYAIEYSIPYVAQKELEPYYPVKTAESEMIYNKYLKKSRMIDNLYICGRLADFKYYNMDQALERAICVSEKILEK